MDFTGKEAEFYPTHHGDTAKAFLDVAKMKKGNHGEEEDGVLLLRSALLESKIVSCDQFGADIDL